MAVDLQKKLEEAQRFCSHSDYGYAPKVEVRRSFISRTLRPIGIIPSGADVLVVRSGGDGEPDRINITYFPDDDCTVTATGVMEDVDTSFAYQVALSALLANISDADLLVELNERARKEIEAGISQAKVEIEAEAEARAAQAKVDTATKAANAALAALGVIPRVVVLPTDADSLLGGGYLVYVKTQGVKANG